MKNNKNLQDKIDALQKENEALQKEGMTIYATMNDRRVEQLTAERDELKEEVKILCRCLNGSTKAIYDAEGFDLAVKDLRENLSQTEAENLQLREAINAHLKAVDLECSQKHAINPYDDDYLNEDYHLEITLSVGEIRKLKKALADTPNAEAITKVLGAAKAMGKVEDYYYELTQNPRKTEEDMCHMNDQRICAFETLCQAVKEAKL